MNYIALPWNPTTPWTPTLSYWVNNASHSFKQSINISAILPYTPLNTINMAATVMQAPDLAPSTTFTSAYLNIFSNYSSPLVDNMS